jgi:hypothetical protein
MALLFCEEPFGSRSITTHIYMTGLRAGSDSLFERSIKVESVRARSDSRVSLSQSRLASLELFSSPNLIDLLPTRLSPVCNMSYRYAGIGAGPWNGLYVCIRHATP